MIDTLAESLEICLWHVNESPARIRGRIAETPGLDDKARGQLLRRMIVENFKSLRYAKSTKSVESQLDDFAADLDFPDDDRRMWKLVRRLIAVDIATSRAAVDRDEMKELYPEHAQWIDRCLAGYKALTYDHWLGTTDILRRKRQDAVTLSDEYVVEKHIGRGGLKDVYRVVQKSTGQIVALKELRPHGSPEAVYQDMLRREAILQAKLQHQGVPSVLTLDDRDADNPVFLEHHISGKPWSELIDGMSLDENLRVLLRTANIVAFAHKECRIIHADLKPENVMIDQRYGEIHLVDWGLAIDMETEGNGTDDSPVMGTPDYMAPESQAPRNLATPALDVFLLGGILFRALAGRPPFPQRQNETPTDISLPAQTPLGEAIPPELAGVALKALDRDPAKRFADAAEFAKALEQYVQRAEMLQYCAATERRYHNALEQRNKNTNAVDNLAKHTIELIEIANEFRFVKDNLQKLGNDSDDALIEASRSEKKARLSLVDTAMTLGDLGMAEGQLNLAESLTDPMTDGTEVARRRRQIEVGLTRRRRDRRMRLVAALLGALALLGVLGTLLQSSRVAEQALRIADEKRKNTEQALRITDEKRKNAEQALENLRLHLEPLLQKEQMAAKQRFAQGSLVFLANALTFDKDDTNTRHRLLHARLQALCPSAIRLFASPPTGFVEQDKVNQTQAVVLAARNELVFPSWEREDVLQTVSFDSGRRTGCYRYDNAMKYSVFALAASPDESRIAAILESGDLVVWETGKSKPYTIIHTAISPIQRKEDTEDSKEGGLAFRSDGRELVFIDGERQAIALIDFENDDAVELFPLPIPDEYRDRHSFVPNEVFFTADDKQLFVLLEDKKEPPFYVLSWWEIETGRCVLFLPCLQGEEFDNRHGDMLREICGATVAHAVSPNGEYFLVTNFLGDLCLVDLEQRQILWQRITPGDVLENYSTWNEVRNTSDPKVLDKVVKSERSLPPAIAHLSFSSDGRLFVSTSHNGIIRVHNTQTGDPVGTFAGLPQGLCLKQGISLADLTKEEFLESNQYVDAVYPAQRFRPLLGNDDQLAVLGSDGYLRLWSPPDVERTQRELIAPPLKIGEFSPAERMLADWGTLNPGGFLVRVAPGGEEFAILGEGRYALDKPNDGRIGRWKTSENESIVSPMDAEFLNVRDAAYFVDENGTLQLILSANLRLVQFDAATGKKVAEFEAVDLSETSDISHSVPAFHYAVPAEAVAANLIAGENSMLTSPKKKRKAPKLFFERFFTQKIEERNKKVWWLSRMPLACIAVSPACSRAAARGNGGEIVFWDLQSKKRLETQNFSEWPIWSLAFREDGKRLAALDASGKLLLIDMTVKPTVMTMKDQETLTPPWRTPHGLLFLPDGKLLQFGLNGTLLIWNTDAGEIVQRLETNLAYTDVPEFESAAVSRDGLMLFAGNNDGLVYCWERKAFNDPFVIKTIFRAVPSKSLFHRDDVRLSVQGLGVLSNDRELIVTTAHRRLVVDLETIMKDTELDAETRRRQIEALAGLKVDDNGFLVPNPPMEILELQEATDELPTVTEPAIATEGSPGKTREKPTELQNATKAVALDYCPNKDKFVVIKEKEEKADKEWKEINEKYSAKQNPSASLSEQVATAEKNLAIVNAATAKRLKILFELLTEYEALTQDCVRKNCPCKDEHLKILKEEKETWELLHQIQEEEENDSF